MKESKNGKQKRKWTFTRRTNINYTPNLHLNTLKLVQIWMAEIFMCSSIAFYTGLKKGKIHALKWTDIDGKYLNVTRSISQKLRGEDRKTAPKNKSSIRTLQLPIPLIKILEEHKKTLVWVQRIQRQFQDLRGNTSAQRYQLSKNERTACQINRTKNHKDS